MGGYLARALTRGGAAAAVLVGTGILVGGGWPAAAVLLTFFVSGSAVSRWLPDRGSLSLDAKGDCRDQWQVLANGGAAALGAVLARATPGAVGWIVTCSLGAAAADTWATSFGEYSRRPPRDIATCRLVPPGTSGGVTLRGCIGGAAGGLVVAAVGASAHKSLTLLAGGLAIGFFAMMLDSILGSIGQGKFHCPRCDQPTERRRHRCGSASTHRAGLVWLDNDGVNAVATSVAALAGWGVAVALGAA